MFNNERNRRTEKVIESAKRERESERVRDRDLLGNQQQFLCYIYGIFLDINGHFAH